MGYPETFSFDFKNNVIILSPDQPSMLLEMIKTNPQIKQQLIQTVQSKIPLFNPIVEVYISTHGNDIVFNIVYKLDLFTQIPELGVYSNIVSTMDLKSLNDWCRTNTKFNNYCKSNQFWIALMKERFREYLVKTDRSYNWEKIYKGFLYYEAHEKVRKSERRLKESELGYFDIPTTEKRKIFLENGFWDFINNKYPEFIDYIVRYDVVLISDNYRMEIMTNVLDPLLARYLVNKFKLTQKDLDVVYEATFLSGRVEILKVIDEYISNNDIDIFLDDDLINKFLSGVFNTKMSPEMFEYITEDKSLEYEDYLYYLGKIGDSNEDMIEYLMSKIDPFINPTTSTNLSDLITEILIVKSRFNVIKEIYKKYKKLFNKDQLQSICEEADIYYFETNDETIHDIFGWEVPDRQLQ